MKNHYLAFLLTLSLLLGMPLLVYKQMSSSHLDSEFLWSDSIAVPNVFYPSSLSPSLKRSIDDFSRVLSEMSGQSICPKKSPLILSRGFYFSEAFSPSLPGVFSFIGDDRLISDKMYASLRKAGVAWFNGSELGESIPLLDSIKVEDFFSDAISPYERSLAFFNSKDRTEYSGFISVSLSGVSRDYSRRNSLYRSVVHGHSLRRILTKEVFEEKPEWFPLYGTKRYGPPNAHQPNFSSMESAEYVGGFIAKKATEKPRQEVFSVCINDNSNFGQQLYDSAFFDKKKYFRGYPDLAPYVFNWTNHVGISLADSQPQKYVSQYAYALCEKAPDFKIESNVVPILTADRSQWYDAEFKQEDIDNVTAWMNSGADIVGTYDYLYGKPFFIPRIFDASLYESLQTFYSLELDSYYAEIYPHPAFDSFKQWMLVEVLKDPSLSFGNLRDIFFSRYYGSAGNIMRNFFDECERIWMGQAGKARWIKYYADVNQAFVFSESEIRKLRDLLNDALGLSYKGLKNTEDSGFSNKCFQRVLATSEFFYFTQLMHDYVQTLYEIAALDSSAEMNEENCKLIRRFYEMKKSIELSQEALIAREYNSSMGLSICEKYGIYTGEIHLEIKDSFDEILGVNTWRRRPNYTLMEDVCMDVLSSWKVRHPESVSRFVDTIHSCDRDMANLKVLKSDFQNLGENLLMDPSFERQSNAWRRSHRNAEGLSFVVSQLKAYSGKKSYRIKNAIRATLSQYVRVEPQKKYLLEAYVNAEVSESSRVAFKVYLLDENKKSIRSFPQARLGVGTSSGWKRLAIVVEAPEKAYWARVQFLSEYQEKTEIVYLDNLSMREIK